MSCSPLGQENQVVYVTETVFVFKKNKKQNVLKLCIYGLITTPQAAVR